MKRTLATILALVTVLSCLGAVFASAEGVMRGDVYVDGTLNSMDYMLLCRYLMGTFMLGDSSMAAADIDGDGEITETDYLLLKRHVLKHFVIREELPKITEEDGAFATDLQTAVVKTEDGKQLITVTLTFKDIKDGVQMQELLAKLHYDPEQLHLVTKEIEDDVYGWVFLDCAVTMPGSSWENLCREDSEGVINIGFVGINPSHLLTSDAPLELNFQFEPAEGVTEATVSVDTVRSAYAASGATDLTVYHGESASVKVKADAADPGEDPGKDPGEDPGEDPGKDPGKDPGEDPGKDPGDRPSPTPSFGDPSGDGKIDSTDYLMVKRFYLGLFKLTDEQKAFADINKDGKVNAVDYLMIKRHVLGTFKIV